MQKKITQTNYDALTVDPQADSIVLSQVVTNPKTGRKRKEVIFIERSSIPVILGYSNNNQ